MVEQQLPVETLYVESVPEGKVEPFIDRLVGQGAKVIFTTSFGFMDGTVAAAQRYPNVVFAHASGFKRARNLATYMADFYQVYYLNGLMAGALTKTNKVGYVGAFPIPEVKRHLDAYALGVRYVNPQATINVRWLQDWINPLFVSRLKSPTVKTVEFGTLSVYDLVQRRIAQMSKNPVVFDPFAGPIQDRKGVVRVPAGHTMTVGELTSMEWAAPGVVGPWPGEP